MGKKKNRKFNQKPPFYWPLILLLIVFVELAVLIKERTWSQKYAVTVLKLRDQVEKIDNENKLMTSSLYDLYSIALKNFENNSTSILATPERKIILKNKETTILGAINEKRNRY